MEVIENWGQEVLIPSSNEWEDILETAFFLGNEVVSSTLKAIKFDIENFNGSAELFIGFVQRPRINTYVRLLRLNDEFHRIHIEDVICEYCDERSGYSATPYLQSYEGAPNKSAGIKAILSLPVENCKFCKKTLKQRHTLWFANH